MSVIGFIFARGGSKGLPGKNILPIAGKPLLAHTIAVAKKFKPLDRLIVSTDDQAIAEVALEFGAEVPFMRPAELAQDNSAEWAAWQHAVGAVGMGKADVFVSLPATAPCRAVSDLECCWEKFRTTEAEMVVTFRQAERSPYFNMVSENVDGTLSLVMSGEKVPQRRQDVPTVFDLTTVAYMTTVGYIQNHNGLFEGKVAGVEIPRERAIDIDDVFDFKVAEMILNGGMEKL